MIENILLRSSQSVSGPSRCFPFWQEVLACYVVNTNAEDDSGKKKCVPVLEDYYEYAPSLPLHQLHPSNSLNAVSL